MPEGAAIRANLERPRHSEEGDDCPRASPPAGTQRAADAVEGQRAG